MKKSLLLCVALVFLSIGFAQAGLRETSMEKVEDCGSTPRSISTQVQITYDDASNALSFQIFSIKAEVATVTITNASGEVCAFSAVATNGTESIVSLPADGSPIYTIKINIAAEQWNGILSL